jgi:hypothetical protein
VTDLKISQLPGAATPLTGAELIELVQSGANVQSTVGALAPAPTTSATFGNPNAPFNVGFGSHLKWNVAVANFAGVMVPVATCGDTGTTYTTGFGSLTAQHPNPGGATVYAASNMGIITSTAATNSAADINNGGDFGVNSSEQMWRVLSPALPISGFTMVFYGGIDAMPSLGALFFGMSATNGSLPQNQVPSALLNCIGFSKDSGDTNIQFIINNGAGSATKTDTGIPVANIIRHMLKIVITADVLGNVVASLTDVEAGGSGTVSYSVATATAKLPAANASVQPHYWASTQGQATAVGIATRASILSAGFI